MDTFYNKVRNLSFISWIIVAFVSCVLIIGEVNFVVTLVVAMLLGLILNFLIMVVMVKLENNKLYINKDVKKKIYGLNICNSLPDSFVLVNAIDMLCPNAKDSCVVKIILTVCEKGKEKSKSTYYIKQDDDSINEMVKEICEYKENTKLYTIQEFEEELIKTRKDKGLVYFNISTIAKLLNQCSDVSAYDRCLIVGGVVAQSNKYKNYTPYMEVIYQTNGLVEDKTSVMVDFYLSMTKNEDITVKDLLSLGVK